MPSSVRPPSAEDLEATASSACADDGSEIQPVVVGASPTSTSASVFEARAAVSGGAVRAPRGVFSSVAPSAHPESWSSSLTWRPKRASHCAIIASIAASFAPISLRTCSTGRPFGCTLAGASSPAGTWPNLTTTNVSTCCAMDGFVAAACAGQHLLQSSGRSGIGQAGCSSTRRRPLSRQMPAQLLAGHAFDGRLQGASTSPDGNPCSLPNVGLERHVLSVNRTAPR